MSQFQEESGSMPVWSPNYYKNKCGYNLEGTYMVKVLKDNRFTKIIINISILVSLFGIIINLI